MRKLIDHYDLIPHPEGGFYKEIYRSKQAVSSTVVQGERQAVTHIYFLLARGQISRFHKVLHDEIWSFYEGAPLRLLTLKNHAVTEQFLGGDTGTYVGVIEGGVYQAAETTGDYTLVGCSVAPGFDFSDFSFLRDNPALKEMVVSNAPEFERFL